MNHVDSHWTKTIKCPIGCNAVLKGHGKEHTEALEHYSKCPLMMIQCDICNQNHFPNQNSYMECVNKLLSLIKEKDRVIDEK